MTAREKRVLLTYIYGEAWEEFCSSKNAKMRKQAFVKTGLHLTLDDTQDKTVVFEGLPHNLDLVPPGVPFNDHDYGKVSYQDYPGFVFADAEGCDSQDEKDSATESEPGSDSDDDSIDSHPGEHHLALIEAAAEAEASLEAAAAEAAAAEAAVEAMEEELESSSDSSSSSSSES